MCNVRAELHVDEPLHARETLRRLDGGSSSFNIEFDVAVGAIAVSDPKFVSSPGSIEAKRCEAY